MTAQEKELAAFALELARDIRGNNLVPPWFTVERCMVAALNAWMEEVDSFHQRRTESN